MDIHLSGHKFSLLDGFILLGLIQILSGFSFNHAPHQWNEVGPTIKCLL